MSKHTPGPWEYEKEHRDCFSHTSGHYTAPVEFTTIFMDDGNELDGENRAEVHGPNQEANARLIAAAPDMLEALKLAKDIIGHPDDPFTVLIESTIAKAEGRT